MNCDVTNDLCVSVIQFTNQDRPVGLCHRTEELRGFSRVFPGGFVRPRLYLEEESLRGVRKSCLLVCGFGHLFSHQICAIIDQNLFIW